MQHETKEVTREVRLLGAPMVLSGTQVCRLERKAAGVLAYVALEGETSRAQLAELLWPDSRMKGGAALRQVLLRLRRAVAADVLVALAERRWVLSPASEDACRRVMRLYHLNGDRAAALNVYRRLCDHLRQELETEPLPETRRLARELHAGLPTQRPACMKPAPLPLAVLRPPLLVERDAAWQRLEEGFEARRLLVVSGSLGVGKTRLAADFAQAHEPVARLSPPSAGQHVPYGFFAGVLRYLLASRPDVVLPVWARRELALILPELARPEEGRIAAADADPLRLHAAAAEAVRHAAGHLQLLLVDDAHLCDAESFARIHSLADAGAEPCSSRSTSMMPLWLLCLRPEALAPALKEVHAQAIAANDACVVTLAPLTSVGVQLLLSQLTLPDWEREAQRLAIASAGNPLVLLELVKGLLETDAWGREDPAGPLPTERVSALLHRWLKGLSAQARQLADVAAVTGSALPLSAAAEVLGCHPLELTEAVAELEGAGLLGPENVLLEALRISLPDPTRRFLVQRLRANDSSANEGERACWALRAA